MLPAELSNYCKVRYQLSHESESDSRVLTYSDYKVTNWTDIKVYLNDVDFFSYSTVISTAVIIDDFYHIINTCIELFVYKKSCSVKYSYIPHSTDCFVKKPLLGGYNSYFEHQSRLLHIKS